MNSKLKPGYFIGLFITIFFITEHFLISNQLDTKEIIKTVIAALVAGAFAGFIFEWAIGIFRKFMQSNVGETKFIKDVTTIPSVADEEIVLQTGANHIKGWEAVGGKLYLTRNQLIFKSHKFNIQNHELQVPFSDIENIKRFKAYRLVNSGIVIETKENRKEKFVVDDVEECYSLLLQSVNQLTKT